MRVGVPDRRPWRQAPGRARHPLPALTSVEARLLAGAWTLAALTTLAVALTQGLRMFLLSLLAVLFGTLAALWMLKGPTRR